jgi:anti-sigma B factor antagonist
MTILYDTKGVADIARMPGKMVLANAASLRGELLERIATGNGRIVLDLARVEFADSSGLSAILACVSAARRRGGDLALLAPAPRVRALIELTRLDDVVLVTTDESMAVDRVSGRSAA